MLSPFNVFQLSWISNKKVSIFMLWLYNHPCVLLCSTVNQCSREEGLTNLFLNNLTEGKKRSASFLLKWIIDRARGGLSFSRALGTLSVCLSPHDYYQTPWPILKICLYNCSLLLGQATHGCIRVIPFFIYNHFKSFSV